MCPQAPEETVTVCLSPGQGSAHFSTHFFSFQVQTRLFLGFLEVLGRIGNKHAFTAQRT